MEEKTDEIPLEKHVFRSVMKPRLDTSLIAPFNFSKNVVLRRLFLYQLHSKGKRINLIVSI